MRGSQLQIAEKRNFMRILERIPVLIEEAENLHFEYLAEIGKDVPTLKVQKEQYLRKKDQAEKFLSAGFLIKSAYQRREYSRVLTTLKSMGERLSRNLFICCASARSVRKLQKGN